MNRTILSPALKMTVLLIFVFSISAQLAFAKGKTSEVFVNNPIIGEIDSISIQITDIEDKQINELRHQLYEALLFQLKKNAIRKLAAKYPRYNKKASVNITDREAKAFYEANNLASRGSYEQLYPMIKKHLEQIAEAEKVDQLFQQAVREKLVVSHLEIPNDFLIKVPIETAHVRGNKNARVMLLEFSDYQCPFCARVQPTISMLQIRYEKVVAFGYRHAPLPFHREADEAAIAAECARDQGKFPEFHDLMFKNPTKQYVKDLKAFAKKLRIKNLDQFNRCLDEEKYRTRVERDLEAAAEAGIKGAPGFIVGVFDYKTGIVSGEIISGAQPQNVFISAIEKYLKKTR